VSVKAAPAGSPPLAGAAAYYKRCPTFKFKGKHKLFHHAVSCAKSKKKSVYVLKHRKAPKGWKCSLKEFDNGYVSCKRGAKAFEYIPA
jgi:hypothetical protein